MTLQDRITRRLPVWLLAALLFIALAAIVCPAWAQEPESIRLTAKPSVIVADGSSASTITAVVRDRSGRLLGNGEVVHFSTTLGNIESAAQTQGGQASVTLTSATVPGTATVTASSGHATTQIQVTFANQVIGAESGSRAVIVRARYLLYNDYEQVLDAAEDVDIRVGGLHFKADRAQLDFTRGSLVAQGQPGASNLIITGGDTTLAVDRLHYQWDSRLGYVSGLAEPLRGLFTFNGATLTPVKMTTTVPDNTFVLRDLTPGPLLIKANRVVFLPGEEVQFSGAQIMLNGKRRLSLPIHVMPLGPSHIGQAQYLGMGPRGPLVDVPYYLLAGEKGTSQLRLKYNAPEGMYGATVPGWALDLLGKYNLGGSSDGSVELTRITSPDWGFMLTHNQTFGPSTRAYLNLDTRAGNGFSTRYAIGNFTMWHQGEGYALNLYGTATRYTSSNAQVAASISSTARPLPGGFSWSSGLQVARRWLTVTQKNEAGEDVVQHNQTDTEGVNVRLNAPRQTIAGMRVTASVGPGLTYTNGRPLQSLVGTVGASRTLGKRGSFNLTYNYNDFGLSSDDSTRYVGLDRQTVTTTLAYAAYPRWSLSAFATLGLEHHSQNVRLSADYRFSNQWSLGVNAGYFRQILSIRDVVDPELFRRDTFGATNVEVRLTRVLGERALSVVYESYRNRVYLDYMPGATW